MWTKLLIQWEIPATHWITMNVMNFTWKYATSILPAWYSVWCWGKITVIRARCAINYILCLTLNTVPTKRIWKWYYRKNKFSEWKSDEVMIQNFRTTIFIITIYFLIVPEYLFADNLQKIIALCMFSKSGYQIII